VTTKNALNGYVVLLPEGSFRARDNDHEWVEPRGIYMHRNSAQVFLNYSGADNCPTFYLPVDPGDLREIARALQKLAKDIESPGQGAGRSPRPR
jgi:hypothetical protein